MSQKERMRLLCQHLSLTESIRLFT